MRRHQLAVSAPEFVSIRGSLVRWLFIAITLGLSLLVIDFFSFGPVATWFLEITVNQPVERRYGFTAEWQDLGSEARLVVTSVEPNGRFARAGIEKGFAFRPADCGNFYMAGGHLWFLSRDPAGVRMETVAGDRASAEVFRFQTAP